MNLHDGDPLGEQKLAQAGAVAAGTLDPDHDVIVECPQPPEQLEVAVQVRLDLKPAENLAEPVERFRDVLVLVRVHAHCDHRFLLIVGLVIWGPPDRAVSSDVRLL